MTASELIKQLEKFPPDVKIVVRGYEDGYNDILKLRTIKIVENHQTEYYYGEYFDSKDEDGITAVDLYGENKNAET